MKKKVSFLVFICLIVMLCTSCKIGYDFTELENKLSENGEKYHITLADNGKDLYIERTYTLAQGGRTKESISKLDQEEYEKWANGLRFLICKEQNEFEDAFRDNGDDFDVHIAYHVFDYDGNYIGDTNESEVLFTQADLRTGET